MDTIDSQSEKWDYFFDLVSKNGGKRLDGFPFNVTFPKMYVGAKYMIILVSGEVFEARVDASRQWASEGLEWKTQDGNKAQCVVAAWKEII